MLFTALELSDLFSVLFVAVLIALFLLFKTFFHYLFLEGLGSFLGLFSIIELRPTIACVSDTRTINLHPSTSLTKSQKAVEAHGCKPWVTNLSIVPHTLGVSYTSRFLRRTIFADCYFQTFRENNFCGSRFSSIRYSEISRA